jgi:hypothetical protein
VPELEERVLGYLCEAAAGVKLVATLDDTGRLLAEVRGVLRVGTAFPMGVGGGRGRGEAGAGAGVLV